MKKSKKFMINLLIVTVTSFVLRSLGLAFSVYLSNTVGAEAMGVFHLVLSVYFFTVTIATSGIGLTITKLVSEELALGRDSHIGSLVKKGMLYCVTCSLFGAVILWCFAPFLVRVCFHGIIGETPLYILAIGLPFLSVSSALSGYFTARRKVLKTSLGQIGEQLVKMGATFCMLPLFSPKGLEETLCALVLGGTVSEVVGCLYLWLLYRWEPVGQKSLVKVKGQWKQLLSFSVPIALSSYLRSGLSGVKQLMIPARMSGKSARNGVAQYGIVTGMVFPVLMFPQVILAAFSSLLVPEITEKYVLGQTDSMKRLLGRIFKVTLIFAVCVGGILFLYANDICQRLYAKTEPAFYLKLLAPLVVVMYLDDIVDAVLKGINCQVAVVRINILDSAISIVLLWFLLPGFYVKGYLLVIFLSEIINGAFSMITLLQHTDFTLSPIRWILVPAVTIWVAMLCAKILVPFSMTFSIALAGGLYFCILYVLGILNYEDFRL